MTDEAYDPQTGLPSPIPKELVCPITQELMVRLQMRTLTPSPFKFGSCVGE